MKLPDHEHKSLSVFFHTTIPLGELSYALVARPHSSFRVNQLTTPLLFAILPLSTLHLSPPPTGCAEIKTQRYGSIIGIITVFKADLEY